MTTMIAELYDALIAAGTPEDKARKAAEAMAGFDVYEQRFVRVEADIAELKQDMTEVKRDLFLLLRERDVQAVASDRTDHQGGGQYL